LLSEKQQNKKREKITKKKKEKEKWEKKEKNKELYFTHKYPTLKRLQQGTNH